jgi:hypothetical protein
MQNRIQSEIGKGSYASATTGQFISAFKEILNLFVSHLSWKYVEELKLVNNDDVKQLERINKKVVNVTIIITLLSQNLKFIFESKAHNTPWRIVEPFVKLSNSLIKNTALIITPRWEYNYSYCSITAGLNYLAALAANTDPSLKNSFQELLSNYPFFFSLSFPPVSSNNCLFMAIWAHEIGHLIDNFFGYKETNQPTMHKSSILLEKLKDLSSFKTPQKINGLIKNSDSTKKKAYQHIVLDTYTFLYGLLKKWAKEIFADIFSIHLMGPAALFANCFFLNSLSKNMDLYDVKDPHPPFRLRLKIMLKVYEQWSNGDDWISQFENKYQDSITFNIHSLYEL